MTPGSFNLGKQGWFTLITHIDIIAMKKKITLDFIIKKYAMMCICIHYNHYIQGIWNSCKHTLFKLDVTNPIN